MALLVVMTGVAARAQVKLGDWSFTGVAGLSAGYTGQFGDLSSSHGLAWGGQTTLNGNYYNPRLLNFTIVPYFNQSRANSDSASVTNASGVSAGLNLFSGSKIPVSLSYSYSDNSLSNYNLGQTLFTTHGNGSTFSIGSSLHLSKLPSLMFLYQQGNTNSNLYGNSQEVSTHYHTFMVNAIDRVDGFQLQGGFQTHWGDNQIPDLFSNTVKGYDNSSQSYSASVSHKFPFQGGIGVGYSHETFNDRFTGGFNRGAIDMANGDVSMHPTKNLELTSNVNFNDNLAGVLQQSIVSANGVTVLNSSGQRSNGLLISNTATYTGIKDIGISAGYTYAQQTFGGVLYNSQSITANISYAHNNVLHGMLTGSFGVTEDIRETNERGYRAMAGWSRHFGAWGVNTGINYHRSDRAVLLAYTTTGYSYSANVSRKLSVFQWTASFSAADSKFDQLAKSSNTSRSYSMNLGAKYVSIGGAYTTSSGNSFLSSTGLTTSSLPPDVLASTILFGGNSYSVNGAVFPVRGLQLDGSYVKAHSSTLASALSSWNTTSQTNLRLTYIFRKLSFTSGYTNFSQGFSASSTGPTSFSTFYFGLERWFNFM